MRLGIIFPGLPLGYDDAGYATRASIFLWLEHLTRHFAVEMVCPVVERKIQGHRLGGDIRIFPVPAWDSGLELYSRQFPRVAAAIWRHFQARAGAWDAVLIIDPDPLSQVAFAAACYYGVPRILYLRCNDSEEILARNQQGWRRLVAVAWCGWLEAAVPLMLKSSPGIVTGGELYRKYRPIQPRLLNFYSPSITSQLLRQANSKAPRVKGGLLRLLMVGNLVAVKGFDLAIQAVKILRDRGIQATLEIVGEGPERDRLQQLAQALKVDGMVTFHGFKAFGEDLFALYRQADLFLLSSFSEGTPKVVPEAFAFGLPVVASRVGGILDMVQDGVNGLLIEPGSAKELAAAIEKPARSPELLQRLSEGAAAAAPRFVLENQVDRLAEAIRAWARP
ncbi:MAG: glycosyltransferase [Deltaproteobacteria bacterium]|nr:glycosyltransferase [Deltaproteobacteria bacterium]